jgi:murein DD-endopeptidase MepM/ murein hydrolase activator NlpD
MAEVETGSRRLLVRASCVLAAVMLVATLGRVAGAQTSTEEQLENAEAEFERLTDEIAVRQEQLEALMVEAAVLGQRVEDARGRWEQITEELRNTTLDLRAAQDDFVSLRDELDERARETFITGPGTELEFLLGATSLVDLSARVEFVNALNATDADLATEVQNLKNTLSAEKADQERLQVKAAAALEEKQRQEALLEAKLDEQTALLDDLETKKARARELVERLEKKYKRELAALFGLGPASDGVFRYCPVDAPRAVVDGFGAPRYGGGYHPHAGNDIIAPYGTPIRATFDGYARIGTNSLGGYAVYVDGELGYTYNAHLTAPGVTGPVQAGQIIGYVGTSGNASTPHNHFEWHPNVMPTDWPVSPYGYSVLTSNGAVNPYPLLSQVC